jgi:arabinofuranan 3-O-arabinosyltransferase
MTPVEPRAGRSRTTWLAVALLAALAYVPALASSPGKMPADTKLYLYLNPARLISDAPYTFDARQFAGWVPHQVIAYLWPQGPWFWLGETVRLPDWVAHRLWIGTRRSSTSCPPTSCPTCPGPRPCSCRGPASAGWSD